MQMSMSKRLNDDLSRRDFELPQYGDPDEAFREFEDVYDQGFWPATQEIEIDADHEC
jgi:hypothetical protein